MGVPYCFAWLKNKKKIKLISNKDETGDFYILYFDWNCLFHPECFKVLADNIDLTDNLTLEDKMFNQIIKYTNYVIRFVNPKKYVYFAVDGVAPLAKIRQQRQRRFGYANDYKKEIMNRYNIKYNSWSNVVITPGTDFMNRLHEKIKSYYSNKNNKKHYCNNDNKNLKILYSSYHVNGEGEHKILQDIKKRFTQHNEDNIAIYGLDADLIFLSMASEKNNIYLVREENIFSRNKNDNITETLIYADINKTKICINQTFKSNIMNYLNCYIDFNNLSFTNDYILICYLLGNDFLPHFPSIDLRREGMELVIDKYIEVFCDYNRLIISRDKDNKIVIDSDMFNDFINRLADDEYSFFTDKLRMYMNREKKYKRCYETEDYKIKTWEIENLVNDKIKDSVKLGIGDESEWKYRYYAHMGSEEHQEEFKDEMCKNYLEGILWTVKYYLEECTDWKWQYNYPHSPLISDLANYINKTKFNINSIKFTSQDSLPMYVQLLSVLPPKFNYLLPKSYRHLTTTFESPIIDMYPINYKIDKLYKSRLYQCVPLIPNINIERVINSVKDLELTDKEKKLSEKYTDSYIKLI
jgi:5'-3' exonuclease